MKYDFDTVIDRRGTSTVKYDLNQYIFGQEDLLPMWVADMDFPVAPFILDAIRERLEHPFLGYTFRGPEFAQSVIRWLVDRHGWEVPVKSVDFSPGIVPVLNMAVMEFTRPGDRVMIQPPVYFPFISAVNNHGRELVHNQLLKKEDGSYGIDFEDMEASFREGVKLFIFCNPHNPVGRAWNREELERLAELCVRYDVLVLSDEIHSDLLLFGHRHTPLATISPEIADRCITTLAPSKTFNLAGMYTSVVIATNQELKKAYERILDAVHVGGDNILGQVALRAAYDHGAEWLSQLISYLEENYRLLKAHVAKHCPQVQVSPLEATYLVWLDLSHLGLDDEGLKDFMIRKARLGLNDGPMFGPGGSGHQRINIATPRSVLEEGLQRLSRVLADTK